MTKVILRNGSTAELRKINKDIKDREQLKQLFNRSSKESLYHRFFIPIKEVTDNLIEEMVQTDEKYGLTLVCEVENKIVAIGSYIKTEKEGIAEVSFFVDDSYQGLGLGSILLNQLAYVAWINGLSLLEAYVMPENKKMINVFLNSGFQISQKWENGEIQLTLSLYELERANAIKETREKYAIAATLAIFFSPKNILLLEDDKNKCIYPTIYNNIVHNNYKGKIITRLDQVYENSEFDMAILNLPVEKAITIIGSAKAKIKNMIIMGFYHEINLDTYENRDKLLLEILRKKGIRIIGPYSLGIINNTSNYTLNASYLSQVPCSGSISVASHSGALGLYLIKLLDSIDIGIKNFVSLGNKIDISANDLLQFWEDDINTEIIILYLESFGNPVKFTRLCRRIAKFKPILVVKSARNPLSASQSKQQKVELTLKDNTINNLFKQAGIIRVESTDELLDTIKVFQPKIMPDNTNIAIISNTLEGSIVLTDSLSRRDLTNIEKPVILNMKVELYRYVSEIKKIIDNSNISIILLVYIPFFDNDNSSNLIDMLNKELDNLSINKLIILCILSSNKNLPDVITINSGKQKFPIYFSIERLTLALDHLINYNEYIKKPIGNIPDIPGFDSKGIRKFITSVLNKTDSETYEKTLSRTETIEFLSLMNIIKPTVDANHTFAKGSLFITKDSYFGPLLGFSIYSNEEDKLEEFPYNINTNTKNISVIRLTPLTDIEAEDIIRELLKDFYCCVELRDKLKTLLLKFSILPREVPEINKILIHNILLYKNNYVIDDVIVKIAYPKAGI